jgi:hypothetical protein
MMALRITHDILGDNEAKITCGIPYCNRSGAIPTVYCVAPSAYLQLHHSYCVSSYVSIRTNSHSSQQHFQASLLGKIYTIVAQSVDHYAQ